jgi:hypothetical protein
MKKNKKRTQIILYGVTNFGDLTAVLLNIRVFYAMTPCRLVNSYRRFSNLTQNSLSKCQSIRRQIPGKKLIVYQATCPAGPWDWIFHFSFYLQNFKQLKIFGFHLESQKQYLLTHSLTYLLTYSLIYLLTYSHNGSVNLCWPNVRPLSPLMQNMGFYYKETRRYGYPVIKVVRLHAQHLSLISYRTNTAFCLLPSAVLHLQSQWNKPFGAAYGPLVRIAIYGTAHHTDGARNGPAHRGTALQTGRAQFRFPVWSFEFVNDVILPACLWPFGRSSLYYKWEPGIFRVG